MRNGRQLSGTFSNVREGELSLFLNTEVVSEELIVKSLSFGYFVRTIDTCFEQVSPFLSLAPERANS